jgi:hypothetical protein
LRQQIPSELLDFGKSGHDTYLDAGWRAEFSVVAAANKKIAASLVKHTTLAAKN